MVIRAWSCELVLRVIRAWSCEFVLIRAWSCEFVLIRAWNLELVLMVSRAWSQFDRANIPCVKHALCRFCLRLHCSVEMKPKSMTKAEMSDKIS